MGTFFEFLEVIKKELIVFGTAALPVIELKGYPCRDRYGAGYLDFIYPCLPGINPADSFSYFS